MVRNCVGEALASKNCRRHFRRGRSHAANVGVGREQLKRVVDSDAGAQQQGEIAGEDGDVFRARPRKHSKTIATLDQRVAFLGYRVDRDQSEIFDAPSDLSRRRRRNRAADDLANLSESAEMEGRHRLTARS
jgi:hypothetical protein